MANDVQSFGKAVEEVNSILKIHSETLEKSAQSLKTYNEQIKVVPSQYLTFQKQIADEQKKNAQNLQTLKEKTVQLNDAKSNLNKKTREEIVENRILNQQKDLLIKSNSNLAGAYRNLSAQVAIASEKVRNLIARGKLATQSQSQFNRELKVAQREFQVLQNRVLQADKAVGAWGRTGERSIGFMRNLAGAFGVIGGVTLFATITRDIFEQTKEIQSLNKALETVTGTQENFYNQQAFINRISEDYGVKINDLTRQFTQFYVSAKDKLASQEIQDIFESITKAGASMGLSVESQQRAFLALNQMMSKGTIQAEELRGQLGEALPGAFGIMAKAVGVTEKELGKMMKAGDLIASDVLPKFARELEKAYGIENVERIDNIVSAQNRLSNAWRNFIASLDKDGNKFSAFLTKSLNLLSGVVEGMEIAFESETETRKRIINHITEGGRKEFLDYLTSMTEGQDAMIESTRRYNRSQIAENQESIIALHKRNQELKKGYSDFFTLNKDELKAEYEANKQRIEDLNNVNHKYAGQLQATHLYEQSLIKDNTQKTKELTKAELEEIKRIEEERLKQLFENRKKELELELYVIDQTLNNDETLYATRLRALELHRLKRAEIISLQYQEELRLAKGNHLKEEEALLNYHKVTLEDMVDWAKKMEDIEKDRLKPIDVKNISDSEKDLAESTKSAADELERQNEAFLKNKETLKETQKIIDDYLKSFQEGFFSDAGLPTLFKVLNNEIIGFGENFAVTFNSIAEIAQEAFQFISEASNKNFENEYNNLAKQKEISLLFAGDSASAREEIERQYDQRQRDIKRRQAKAEQKQALFNIAINTAQAIMATYARLGFPAGLIPSIIVGGIGLLQAGAVASQQIPQFWKGTENAPEGWAYTQERGAEIITDKNNKVKYLGDGNGAQLTYLNKGDKVKTASMTKELLSFDQSLNNILLSNNIDGAPRIEVNNNTKILENKLDVIADVIKNKEGFKFQYDKNGVRAFRIKEQQTTELMNSRIDGNGQIF